MCPRSLLPLAALCCFAVSGCGGGGFDTAPVSGVVTHNGDPLENAVVSFIPLKKIDGQAPVSQGRTNADGRYSLKITATQQSGAVVGEHQVRVVISGPEDPLQDVAVEDDSQTLPPQEFRYTVKAGNNEANFDLQSSP